MADETSIAGGHKVVQEGAVVDSALVLDEGNAEIDDT